MTLPSGSPPTRARVWLALLPGAILGVLGLACMVFCPVGLILAIWLPSWQLAATAGVAFFVGLAFLGIGAESL